MPTDVERMAEVLEAHALWGEILVCDCGRWHFDAEVDNGPCSGHAAHVAEQLTAAGMGHIPTALRQAADDMHEVVQDMQSQGEGHPEFHAGALATIKSFRGAIYDAYPESRADRGRRQ